MANNLTTDEEGSVLDARQGKTLEDKKLDNAKVINDLLATQAGFALDARQGKVLNEKINQTNADLEALSTCTEEELTDGVVITRCGRHRVLQISNASSRVAGDIVRLPAGDQPPNKYVMGSATYRGQDQGDYFISITPKGSDVPGKVGLFRGDNAAVSVSGPYIVAHIDWYVGIEPVAR